MPVLRQRLPDCPSASLQTLRSYPADKNFHPSRAELSRAAAPGASLDPALSLPEQEMKMARVTHLTLLAPRLQVRLKRAPSKKNARLQFTRRSRALRHQSERAVFPWIESVTCARQHCCTVMPRGRGGLHEIGAKREGSTEAWRGTPLA